MNFTYRITASDPKMNKIYVEYHPEDPEVSITSYWLRVNPNEIKELEDTPEELDEYIHEFVTRNAPYSFWESSEAVLSTVLNGYKGVVRESTRPEKTEKDLELIEAMLFRRNRSFAVESITVTTQAGNTFEGDETSQNRMARAVLAMEDEDTIVWILADDTVIDVTRDELKEALRLAGAEQAALWVPQEG